MMPYTHRKSDFAMPDAATLLQLSAALAWRIAPQCCRIDPSNGENCAWTHGLWPVLRALGLVGSIEYRAEFFGSALKRVTGPEPRVLLSGAADYATLAFVLDTFRALGAQPQITLVDICETPLAINRWYAEQAGCTIETACCDILEYANADGFDLVYTDAFLGRFPAARRGALVARWHDLLRPGGLAVTYNRLRPSAGDAAVGFSTQQADNFVHTVTAAAKPLLATLGTDANAIARSADVYARRHLTYPVRSADEVRTLFEGAGFIIELLATSAAASKADSVGGPSTRDGGSYVGVIARRD